MSGAKTEEYTLPDGPVVRSDPEATVPDAPAVGSSNRPSAVASTFLGKPGTQSTLTATLALREEQSSRSRGITLMAMLIGALTAITVHLPERQPPGVWIASITSAIVAAYSAGMLVGLRNRPVFDPKWVAGLGFLCLAAILATSYSAGVYSAVVLPAFIGIYYLALGDSDLVAWSFLLATMVGWGALSVLAMVGIIDTGHSIFAMVGVERISEIVLTVGLEAMFALTFVLGRWSRIATLTAVERLERANRQIRKRDALLDEARDELDRARDAGKIGRFTDVQVSQWWGGEIIGRGAMGEVYRARHVVTNREAALKVLHPHLLGEELQAERFIREAESAGAIDSSHIVEVYESGVADDGSPFLVMELLEGEDLADQLRRDRRLGTTATVELVTQVAEGLAAAQEAGIVHRDLKPQNLFRAKVGKRKIWKILDFGVATVQGSAGTLTQGAAIGTPSYMSPEQARGKPVDHRADVFALGIIAYRTLTGRPAFTAQDALATMYNVVHVQPAKPSETGGNDTDVDRVLALALAKDKDRRFSSATAFAAALRDAVKGRLDDRFRRDADDLLRTHPWGADDSARPTD